MKITKSPLKVAHCVAVTPFRCGMYMTVHEVVKAEIEQGIDARIVDVGNEQESNGVSQCQKEMTQFLGPQMGKATPMVVEGAMAYLKAIKYFKTETVADGTDERGVTVESIEWAKNEADILVGHSGFPDTLQNLDKPYIMCMHGRPRSSFKLEWYKEYPIYSGYVGLNEQKRIRKFVTFWKEHIPQHELIIDPEKLKYIPPCVDLDVYNPEGDVAKLDGVGEFNILIADIWRHDIDPYDLVHICNIFCKRHPEAKFHMFGCRPTNQLGPWGVLLGRIKMLHGTLGTHVAMISKMPDVYRSVDMMVTPHRIATRTVREALASGLPLVAADGNPYTPYKAPLWNYEAYHDLHHRGREGAHG